MNSVHCCALITIYYHSLPHLSRFSGFFKINYRLSGAGFIIHPTKIHNSIQTCHSFSPLWPQCSFLLLNMPNFHSSFKAQRKYPGSVKTLMPQADLNSSSLLTNSPVYNPLLHASMKNTCMSISEVLETISHILFTWHCQGLTWWQALGKCSLSEHKSPVRNPCSLSTRFLNTQARQSLRIHLK